MTPASSSARLSSEVATGRRMKGSDMLMGSVGRRLDRQRPWLRPTPQPPREAIEVEVDDRRRVERQQLREQQAADDRDAERAAQLGPGAGAQRQRQDRKSV